MDKHDMTKSKELHTPSDFGSCLELLGGRAASSFDGDYGARLEERVGDVRADGGWGCRAGLPLLG